jgi:hypothetical protein
MKTIFRCLFLMAFVSLGILFHSCKKPGSKKDFSAIEKRLTDSLDKMYSSDELNYVFFDTVPVYKDELGKQWVDHILLGQEIYIDSILQPFISIESADKETSYLVKLSYIASGKVWHGYTQQNKLAKQFTWSKQDTTILLMGNYIPGNGDENAVQLKVLKNKKLVAEFIPDSTVSKGYWLDLYVMDSVSLKDAGDVVFLSTYYPACGYESDDWYFSFKNNRFTTLSHTNGWADAPYWMNTSVYLPMKTDKGMLMAMWSSNYVVRDTNHQIMSCQLPDEYVKNIDQMIYQESRRSYEMLTKNGEPLLDKNDEARLGEELYEKRWLKWNGTNLEMLKVDTTVWQFPDVQ